MNSDRLRLYIIEFSLILVLLLALIFNEYITRTIIMTVLLVFMVIAIKFIKGQKTETIYKKQMILLVSTIAIIYVAILYMLGIKLGFYSSAVKFSKWSIINYIIPYVVIIISSEIIRKQILIKQQKKANLIILIAMILLEIIISTNISSIKTLKDYFTLVSYTIFTAIANNVLYNYIVTKYGNYKAVICYRIITLMYMYIIPITPDIDILFRAIIGIVVPYVTYVLLENLYSKRVQIVAVSEKRKEMIICIILCILVSLLIMVVSCRFRYGTLVIGTGSMTGTINKGDIIIYERYEKEELEIGEIIVFKTENVFVIHRIIDKKSVGEEIRYYTKGDANQQEDKGFRTQKNIVGIVKGKIPYIGKITLLLNDIINK
ncbi:MAG: signal peptidase I [Lachnospirales bacterium]